MDIILVVILFIVGYFRVKFGHRETNNHNQVQENVVAAVQTQITIGNNLMLQREKDAFMRIVEELNLR